MDAERANMLESLRHELLYLVKSRLTPMSQRYRYSDIPLESGIRWKPIVLVLGNYSSGKSTLINEFLGTETQGTGQAPTDDGFTVITYGENKSPLPQSRDGQVLLNDPEYPFQGLQRHGKRFASHFRLKTVESHAVKDLAIIDTPGMLDAVAERDRGYNYQEVIADLAQLADLILVMFDPHKAGTIRESRESLRHTLPQATYEDRVVFVMNRMDECRNLEDLLRVYGTLTWNLSQMTGRKDIPQIFLTYANSHVSKPVPEHLKLLENQRQKLRTMMEETPRHRLDHLANFIEEHGSQLHILVRALLNYAQNRRRKIWTSSILGLISNSFIGMGLFLWAHYGDDATSQEALLLGFGYLCSAVAIWLPLGSYLISTWSKSYAKRHMDDYIPPGSIHDQGTQDKIESIFLNVLDDSRVKLNVPRLLKDCANIEDAYRKGSRELREALSHLTSTVTKI